MMLYICTKFHENISKGFSIIVRTRNHDGRKDGQMDGQTDGQTDRQTDGQTDGQGDYYRAPPTSSGGALITSFPLENLVNEFNLNTENN